MIDVIDAAIAATEQPPSEQRASLSFALPSGRFVAINVPVDLDANEAIALMGCLALQLPVELARIRQPGPQLVVPAHLAGRV